MTELIFKRRMSTTDAVMWAVEKDPMLRSTMTGCAILDQPPEREVVRQVMERASREVVRLRERVAGTPWSIAPPRWEMDHDFDLDYHVRFVRAPGTGMSRDVLDLTQPLAMEGFDRARPLWQLWVVDGLAEGRGATLLKLHHSMTDAVGLLRMAMAFIELERDGWKNRGTMPEEPWARHPNLAERFVDAISYEAHEISGLGFRVAGRLRRVLEEGLGDPLSQLRLVGDTASSVIRNLAPAVVPMSPIMTKRSLSRRLDVIEVPLKDLKAAAKSVKGTLNDAFVAGTFDGLRRYHDYHGARTDALRMSIPINIRSSENGAGGNQFAPLRVPVPLEITDPRKLMRTVHGLVDRARAEPALQLVDPLSGMLYRLGTHVLTTAFAAMTRGVDVVASNVPGSPVPLYFAGSKIEAIYPFGPLAGSAVNLSLLSYTDRAYVGVVIDPVAVPDPDVMVLSLRRGFDAVLAVAHKAGKKAGKAVGYPG